MFVGNSNLKGTHVFTELNPTYQNLIRSTEKEAKFRALTTDFTMIHGGVLHNANEGT